MKTDNATSPAQSASENNASGIMAGPPTHIIFGGIANPQRVRKGNDFQLDIAAQLVDSNGSQVPSGGGMWTTSTPGASISPLAGDMNGRFILRDVQASTIIRVTVSSVTYSSISASLSIDLIAF
ncbi:hypothetical protein D3C78_1076730 [compost metagenome]